MDFLNDGLWINGERFGSEWILGEIEMVGTPASPSESGSGDYSIALFDASGNLLYRNYFDMRGTDDHQEDSFMILIPAASDMKYFKITKRNSGEIIVDKNISGAKPLVQWVSTPTGVVDSVVNVSWLGSDVDSPSLNYLLEYSYDDGKPGTWVLLNKAFDIKETEVSFSVDFSLSRSSSGQSRLRVIASDGVNNSVSELSPPFSVPAHLPTIEISSPKVNELWRKGDLQSFSANLQGVDDGELAWEDVEWSSSKDGEFGNGNSLTYSGLSAGFHAITVSVNTAAGVATKTVENILVAETPPSVSITLGDGDQSGLDCNELKLEVVPGDAPIDDVVWSYFPDENGERKTTHINKDQLPIVLKADNLRKVDIAVSDKLGFSDKKELKIVPNKCP